MARKRGNGEGNIRQRLDGSWEARLTLPGGRRQSFYGKTREAVRVRLTAALRTMIADFRLSPSSKPWAPF